MDGWTERATHDERASKRESERESEKENENEKRTTVMKKTGREGSRDLCCERRGTEASKSVRRDGERERGREWSASGR